MYSKILILAMLGCGIGLAPAVFSKIPEHKFPCAQKTSTPPSYEEILYIAVTSCRSTQVHKDTKELLLKLIDIEKRFRPPQSLRGMLLAAACSESRYNPKALGDHKFSKHNRPKAVGILQLWPWAKRANYTRFGKSLDRRDPIQSAIFWMDNIKRKIAKVRKQCNFHNADRLWRAAWVTAVRYPKDGGRCYERTRHEKLLQIWQKKVKKKRTACAPQR